MPRVKHVPPTLAGPRGGCTFPRPTDEGVNCRSASSLDKHNLDLPPRRNKNRMEAVKMQRAPACQHALKLLPSTFGYGDQPHMTR